MRVRSTEQPLIVIAGSIGVGKSTVARMLRDRFSMQAWVERPERNPLLQAMYDDPSRWAFDAHVVFLEQAIQRHAAATDHAGAAVVDRSPHESVDVFARVLRAAGHVSEAGWTTLRASLLAAEDRLATPTLMLYLHAPVDELMARIAARDRPAERAIDSDYLTRLGQEYDRFVATWSHSPVHAIDSSQVDVREPENIRRLVDSMGLHGDRSEPPGGCVR